MQEVGSGTIDNRRRSFGALITWLHGERCVVFGAEMSCCCHKEYLKAGNASLEGSNLVLQFEM